MNLKVKGLNEVRARLRAIAKKSPSVVGRALFDEAEIEATEAKKRTPVDTGALRASIHVTPPTTTGRLVRVEIVAGGPAVPYALIVHEDEEAFHKVGGPFYISSVLKESERHMLQRIARRLDLSQV